MHGCIGELEELLEQINFDFENDRMFAVGDLIDRGTNSMACLKLLEEPWFFSVLGNHEDMVLDVIGSDYKHGVAEWISNGGDWGVERYEACDPDFFKLVELVDELPMGIIIQTNELGRVGICHAEPPTIWTEECFEKERASILWGRRKIDLPDGELKQSNVDFSVHGHTIGEKVSVRDDIKAFWIDLGCYVTGALCALQTSGAGITWPEQNISG